MILMINESLKLKLSKIIDVIIIIWIITDIVLLMSLYFVNLNSIYYAIVIFDTGLCVVLFVQFVFNLNSIEHKKQYVKDDWKGIIIDILAMLPYELFTLGAFGFLRLLRLVRIFALLGKEKREIYNFIEKTKLNYIIFSFLIFVIGATILILILENSPGSEINNPLNALWYVMATITTVGYGDIVPETVYGKMFGIILMVVGVVFFSLLTASLASWFLRGIESEEEELKDKMKTIEDSINELKSDMKELKELLKK
jgi:voltage-gated potassium channel